VAPSHVKQASTWWLGKPPLMGLGGVFAARLTEVSILYSAGPDQRDVIRDPVDFAGQAHIFRFMKRLAAMMMFAAWLLYGAMPVVAVLVTAPAPQDAMQDHSQHHDMQVKTDKSEAVQTAHQHGDGEKSCPHGSGKGCAAPFCAACLVLLPDIAFADTVRSVPSTPEAEDAPALVISAARPPIPPPRA
jgi:hypothetical protein